MTDLATLDLEELVSLDAADLRMTQDGYLAAWPRVARTGIQLYKGSEVGRPNMEVVRVYRPETEVFSSDAMHTFAYRPVTNDHPDVPVSSKNWKEFAVGQTGSDVARDGDFLRVPMLLMDEAAIGDVRDGKKELSVGYKAALKWEAGTAPNGQQYDAVQTAIRANHIAIVSMARGGPKLRIGDYLPAAPPVRKPGVITMPEVTLKTITIDGIDVDMPETAASIVLRHSKTQADEIKRLGDAATATATAHATNAAEAATKAATDKTAVEGKDAQIATLTTQLTDEKKKSDPAALDALVKDRVATVAKAKAVIGDKLVIDGKSDAEMRRQVVDSKLGDAAKGWTDEQVTTSFATLTAGLDLSKVTAGAADRIAAGFSKDTRTPDIYNAYDKAIGERWKGVPATAH